MTRIAKVSTASLLACILVTGCTFMRPQPDRSRFFVLTSVSDADIEATRSAREGNALGIGLGPLRLPDYLDRPQIVRRVDDNRLAFSELERWAEPLDKNITRVMSQNLSMLLDTDRIVEFPSFTSVRMDYELPMEILRFELGPTGAAHLVVRWGVKGTKEEEVMHAAESRFTETVEGDGTQAIVAALSKLLSDFSEEAAAEIRRVHEARQKQSD
jgi:uncharacterized lipoprotein YmbA